MPESRERKRVADSDISEQQVSWKGLGDREAWSTRIQQDEASGRPDNCVQKEGRTKLLVPDLKL